MHGSARLRMAVQGFAWLCRASHGFAWLCMTLHGFVFGRGVHCCADAYIIRRSPATAQRASGFAQALDVAWLRVPLHGWPWLCVAELCMASHGFEWRCMALQGCAWLCKALHGFAWLCLALHGLHGLPWLGVALPGFAWLCLALHQAWRPLARLLYILSLTCDGTASQRPPRQRLGAGTWNAAWSCYAWLRWARPLLPVPTHTAPRAPTW